MNDRFENNVKDSEKGFDRETREQQKKEYRKRELKGWIFSLITAIVIALALRLFVFEFVRVDGPSMRPTLYTDEYVFMEKVTFWFRAPAKGDIVICSFPDSTESYVKRVVGTPGDNLKIMDGVLYINGTPSYDYFKDIINNDMEEVTVPEGCVFVMGDNRNQSRDSREPDIGPIPYNKILGNTDFVIWPIDKIHGL